MNGCNQSPRINRFRRIVKQVIIAFLIALAIGAGVGWLIGPQLSYLQQVQALIVVSIRMAIAAGAAVYWYRLRD